LAAWSGYSKWGRDYIGALQHLGEACVNKLIVEFEDDVRDVVIKMSKPSFSNLLSKHKDKLLSDYENLNRIRKSRINAVHYSQIPNIITTQNLLIKGIEFVSRGIFKVIKDIDHLRKANIVNGRINIQNITGNEFDKLYYLCDAGLLHVMQINLRENKRRVAEKIIREIYGNNVCILYRYAVLSPLVSIAYMGRRKLRLSDENINRSVLKERFNKIRHVYEQSIIYYGVEKYDVGDFEDLILFLKDYEKWGRVIPDIPHMEGLYVEAVCYMVVRILQILKTKVKNEKEFVNYFLGLVDFLSKNVPNYVIEHGGLSGYLINGNSVDVRFASFIPHKYIGSFIVKKIMSEHKKVIKRYTDGYDIKKLLAKLRRSAPVKPPLVSRVFSILN